jgi:5-methylcytosine-specific restriction endonuclease McrA
MLKTYKKKFLKRKFGKCANCGSIENLTIDHIIPRCLGGSGRWKNLQVLCEKCNQAKGQKVIHNTML